PDPVASFDSSSSAAASARQSSDPAVSVAESACSTARRSPGAVDSSNSSYLRTATRSRYRADPPDERLRRTTVVIRGDAADHRRGGEPPDVDDLTRRGRWRRRDRCATASRDRRLATTRPDPRHQTGGRGTPPTAPTPTAIRTTHRRR